MSFKDTGNRHNDLLHEIAEERFAALARISRALEGQIEQLQRLRNSLATADESNRQQTLHTYRELRARALRHRWYMDVQREVVGLRPHELVDEFYAVPGPVE